MHIRSSLYPKIVIVLALCSGIAAFAALPPRTADAQRPDLEKAKDELVAKGQAAFDRGDYNAAIQIWQTARTLDAGSRQIKKLIKEAEGRIAEAEKYRQDASAGGDVKLISVTDPQSGRMPVWPMQACIDTAVKNHLPLQIAQKNVKLGEMRLFEARRNMLPQVSMQWEETYGEVNARNYYGQKAFIQGQHTVYKGGEAWFTMKQAETNLKILKEEYGRIRNELVLQVKRNYYTLAKSKENLKFQTELKQDSDRLGGVIQKAYDAGVVAKVDYLNVISLQSQVDYQIASAKGDVDIAALILKQTMYVSPKEPLDISVSLEFEPVPVDYDEVVRMAYVSRPEMKINSMMMEYYGYELKVAKARGWPKFDLMGNWGLAKENYTAIDNNPQPTASGTFYQDPVNKMEQQWYAGFKGSIPAWGNTVEYSMTREQWTKVVAAYQGTEALTQQVKVNILDKLNYYSDKQAADIDLDRARQEFLKTKQDVTLEAAETCFTYEKALIQVDTSRKKVAYQERDLEWKRFKASMGESLGGAESSGPAGDVLEAMIRVAQERFSYVSSLADCHIALAAINKAIGIEDYYKDKTPSVPPVYTRTDNPTKR